MTNNEVHEQLIEWLGDLLGVTVIKDRQQADRPATPYGMVDLANWRDLHEHVTDINYTELESENSAGLKEVLAAPVIETEWVFLFFLYGTGAEEIMRRVQSAVHIRQAQSPLLEAGLVIHEVSGANSVPELVGENWEPRAQVNIVVHGNSVGDGFNIDTIEEHGFNFSRERA